MQSRPLVFGMIIGRKPGSSATASQGLATVQTRTMSLIVLVPGSRNTIGAALGLIVKLFAGKIISEEGCSTVTPAIVTSKVNNVPKFCPVGPFRSVTTRKSDCGKTSAQ